MVKATEKGVDLLKQESTEIVVGRFVFNVDDIFIFPGYNANIPCLGEASIWYDCHCCGNATQNKPERCIKCNSGSFEERGSRKQRLKGVA